MTTIVIMPGGFHPYHAGHHALYQSAQRTFPDAEVYVAATNDTSSRPFPFAVKEKLAKLAGVEAGHFVQVKSPFRAEEITAKFDPQKDVLIFVRSEKDANTPPQPGGVKKDGSPSYLQPLLGAKRLEPFAKHAYMAYLPTVEFGPGMTSATQIRSAWPSLDERRKTALVMSLYPKTQTSPKLAQTVVKLLDAAIGGEQGVTEDSIDQRIAYAKKNNPLQASVRQHQYGYTALVTDTNTGKPSWFGGAVWQTPELAMGHAKAFVKGFPYLEQRFAQRFVDKNRDGIAEPDMTEGIMNKIANKVMGAAPEQPKYKVGQRVKYETSPHQSDWADGGSGVGVITDYKNGHYMINGNPVNHFEIKGVVAEGSLNEFASSGSGGNGPFDYGSAIVQIGQDYAESFNDDGDGADAARIVRVGKTFMSKGMSSGIKAFYAMDTFVRDHVAEELSDQGFNVKQDIYAPYKQQMAKAKADTDKYRSSPEYAASRADDLKISAIPEKPINSWSKPGEPAASVSMDNASKRDVKAEFEKFKQDVAQRNSLKGVPLKFVVTVGGKPVDIDKLSEYGVAEASKHKQVPKELDRDPQLRQAILYAKQHYPQHANDPEMAMMKWLQRGLNHSEREDQQHDRRIAQLTTKVASITTAINQLKQQQVTAENSDYLDE